MKFSKILSDIGNQQPEQTSGRRDLVKNLGKGIAFSAIPLAISSLFNKAEAKGTTISDAYNNILRIEYLQEEFYLTALKSGLQMPMEAISAAIFKIATQQTLHIKYLKSLITAKGGTPIDAPTFDFTGGTGSGTGTYAAVFSNFNTFLVVAQLFEDLAVRAYKGAITDTEVAGDNTAISTIMRLHTTEARHASYIRQVRHFYGVKITPWINNIDAQASGDIVDLIYKNENNSSQLQIDMVMIGGDKNITETVATAAFDEPLTTAEVNAILNYFLG